MIKTSADFSNVMSVLQEDKGIGFSGIGRSMNSQEFNSIMYQIEADLNNLYENIRLLNDLTEYIRNYVIKSVENRRAKFIKKLKIIEQLTDSYRDKSYITQMIPFTANQELVRNRKGKIIRPMAINNGKLEMEGEIVGTASIQNIFLDTKDGCSSSSADLLVQGKSSRSIYKMNEPMIGGVKESYEIRFHNPANINYISIDTINCDVSNICGINTSGSKVLIDSASSFMKTQKINGLSFDVTSKNFQNTLLSNNTSNTQTLLIRSDEHRANNSSFVEDEENLSDIEKLSHMGIYRGNYATWLEGAEAVKQKNTLVNATAAKNYKSKTELRTFDSNAIALPDGSILEPFSDTGYQYTPNNNVLTEELITNGSYTAEDVPSFSKAVKEASSHGFQYIFGIDAIKIQQKAVYDECGYVSEIINLGKCSYIELSAIEIGSTPVEYYIIDGTKEISILPVEKNEVIEEPLIYQMSTRFTVNEDEDIIIYEDGVETNLLLNDADTFDYNAHKYTISYTPLNAHKYFPENEQIQVKLIQEKSDLPTTIENISIRKHGGELYWTISA